MLKEDDLRTRLHALADPVQAAANPVTAVRDRARGLRRRRSGTRMTLGVVAMLALGVVAGYGPLPPHHRAPVPGSSASTLPKAPDLAHLRPAQQVWPDAVHLLPSQLADDRGYTVSGALGAGRYLITVKAGFDLLGDIAILDTRHGNALTVLSAADAGQGASQYQPQEPALTTDGVAWVAVAQRDGQWTTEVWASGLTARSAKLVASLPGQAVVASPRQAWVVGDRVVFDGMNGDRPGPMYWVPRSGGAQPKAIPGSQGCWPVTGGWTSTTNLLAPGVESEAGRYDASLFNVLTGARVPIRPNSSFQKPLPDGHVLTSLSCAPSWCLGQATATDGTRNAAVQHPDGTGYTETGPADPIAMFGGGRFVVGYVDLGNDRVQDFIWDVVTGAAGTISPPTTTGKHVMHDVFDPGQNCYTWSEPGGMFVLDGSALG